MKFLLLFFILSVGAVVGSKIDWGGVRTWSSGGQSTGQSSGFSVPELDAGVAGSAVVLLLGGVAYLASRRREDSSV